MSAIMLPAEAMLMPIDSYELKVFAYLIQLNGRHCSTRKMAKVLDLSRKRVEQSLKRLVAMTMVSKERHQLTPRKHGCLYRPLPAPHWFYAYDPTPDEPKANPEAPLSIAWT